MDDSFIIINKAGSIEYTSPSAADVLGYETAALNGQPLSNVLVVPQNSDFATSPFWLRASTSPILQGIHRSGRLFPLRVKEQELHGAGRTHYMLSLHDASESLADEGIFSRHRDLYELATREGRISVWEVDYRTNRLEFSNVLACMLGIPADRIPTTVEDWIPYFYPEDWQMLQRETERMLRSELKEINIECRMICTDGSILWTHTRGRVSLDDNGKPIKIAGTTFDITDRKKAEQERDVLFDSSLDLLCIADTKGYFHRINPAFSRTLGYDVAELTSRPFFDFVHPEDLSGTRKAVAILSEGKNLIAFENRYHCKDGSWCWLSWTCPAVAAGSDTIYAIARDVTEGKRMAAKLQHAMKEAENANRAKSEFLSRMSHELRTPLNAILGFGQLLQREPLTPRQRQQIELIVKGGQHLLSLINEVLDITRIEVGRLTLSAEAVEMTELIQEVVSLAQPLAEQHRIRLAVDLPSLQQRYILADRQRLKQVLLNLVSNAIKYNRERGTVLVRGEEASPGRFRIAVQDTGPGIPEDKLHRLFTPFDRLGAESSSVEGSGLGLVVSKRLVEIMGGTLTIATRTGEGTTFTVELVLGKNPSSREEIVAPLAAVPMTVTGPPRTLLYIEDNLANVQLIYAVLTYRPGIRLLTAMQGGLGLELARQHQPDLILLDVHLPDLMGYEVLGIIRADPQLRLIPVVVISADATSPQIDRLLEGGAKEYLTKPIDVEHFLRVVDRYSQKS